MDEPETGDGVEHKRNKTRAKRFAGSIPGCFRRFYGIQNEAGTTKNKPVCPFPMPRKSGAENDTQNHGYQQGNHRSKINFSHPFDKPIPSSKAKTFVLLLMMCSRFQSEDFRYSFTLRIAAPSRSNFFSMAS